MSLFHNPCHAMPGSASFIIGISATLSHLSIIEKLRTRKIKIRKSSSRSKTRKRTCMRYTTFHSTPQSSHSFPIPHSFLPMRIIRLPHLSRETSRRHDDGLFILLLLLTHTLGSVMMSRRRRILRRRRDAAAFNLQLARLALFLRRQHPARADDGVVAGVFVFVVFVVADVGL